LGFIFSEAALPSVGHLSSPSRNADLPTTPDGKQKKARLEAGYHDYGNRSGWQVLSNSFSAAVACSAWNIFFVPQGVHAWIWGALTAGAMKVPSTIAHKYTSDGWCPLSKDVGDGWSRALLFAALG
jgi:hypothetical protein